MYASSDPEIRLHTKAVKIDNRGVFVISVFSLTILLWMTDAFHGLPSAVSALLPVIVFTATGIIDRKDYNHLEWHILALIAGGIALGLGMKLTGLAAVMVDMIPTENTFVFALLIVATVILSIFMSNTAAANLLIPLGISLATISFGSASSEVVYFGLSIALASSAAMALPISTPPNAIAYAKGVLQTKDFVKVGGFVSFLAVVAISLLGPTIIAFWQNYLK